MVVPKSFSMCRIFLFFNGRSKTNALNISQKMIEMFVRTKHKIDKSHEFALVVVNNDVTWVSLTFAPMTAPMYGTEHNV